MDIKNEIMAYGKVVEKFCYCGEELIYTKRKDVCFYYIDFEFYTDIVAGVCKVCGIYKIFEC